MPQKPPAPSFEDLLDSARQHALRLELRDVYAVGEEREVLDAFLRDGSVPADDSECWSGRLPLVERTGAAPGSSTREATSTSSSSRNPSCAIEPPTSTRCAGSCATSWP
ncbi:hypothetical protein GCM10010421_22750 [Streptomyces glaucus]|uniref:DUF6879 domain-containing protein n=1 Tax=Streptomyces glaucus TaxID=284029 RepID=A0ABN3JKN0_9ACTN